MKRGLLDSKKNFWELNNQKYTCKEQCDGRNVILELERSASSGKAGVLTVMVLRAKT